jgi:hypothetical protein
MTRKSYLKMEIAGRLKLLRTSDQRAFTAEDMEVNIWK